MKYDAKCPLCQRARVTRWFVNTESLWIVEDKNSDGYAIRLLACYKEHEDSVSSQMEGALVKAAKEVARRHLLQYRMAKVDRRMRSVPGHFHVQICMR